MGLWQKVLNRIFVNHHTTRLKEGDKAPAFSGKNEKGEVLSLESFKGKKLVIYFYPQDDTPTCTTESCNLRDNYSKLKKKGYEVLGVSPDDEKSHQKFIKKYKLPFSLLADTDKSVIHAFDVWGSKSVFGKTYDGIIRTTFVIDENGTIERIIQDVEAKNHTEQILEKQTV